MSRCLKPWRLPAVRPCMQANADLPGRVPRLCQMDTNAEYANSLKLGLAGDLLNSGCQTKIRALGMSMLPTIWPGDTVTLQSVSDGEVQVGDIVLVELNGRCLIHRITKSLPSGWITRGDSVPQSDPLIARHQLLGKIICIRRGPREFVPARLTWFRRAQAWLLCHSDRTRSVALRIHGLRIARTHSKVTSKLQPTPTS